MVDASNRFKYMSNSVFLLPLPVTRKAALMTRISMGLA
jgi:hypothetical protein